MTVQLRDGTHVTDRRLDRLKQFDPRSRNFRVAVTQAAFRSYTWSVGTNLDQGSDGACVGFSWAHRLIGRPQPKTGITNQMAKDFYLQAQVVDDWEGGEYPGASPRYSGTSVLAGAKTMQRLGYVTSYDWAFGLDDLRRALGYKGPAVLGINWYEDMFRPDAKGYVRPTGGIAGGHAILAFSVNEKTKRVSLWNSWGKGWGLGGVCHVSFDDMGQLLAQDGEACIPTERK